MSFQGPDRLSLLAPRWKGRWGLVLGGPATRRGPLYPRLAEFVQGLPVGETYLLSFLVCHWHRRAGSFLPLCTGIEECRPGHWDAKITLRLGRRPRNPRPFFLLGRINFSAPLNWLCVGLRSGSPVACDQ